MKRVLFTIAAEILGLLVISSGAFAQEKVPVKVKVSEAITGVVVVHVQKDSKSFDVQCNEGTLNCKTLTSGNYLMVELPQGYGMYESKNIEIYKDMDKPASREDRRVLSGGEVAGKRQGLGPRPDISEVSRLAETFLNHFRGGAGGCFRMRLQSFPVAESLCGDAAEERLAGEAVETAGHGNHLGRAYVVSKRRGGALRSFYRDEHWLCRQRVGIEE